MASSAFAQEANETPSWKWTENEWRGAVERVRAGKSLQPRSWPEGARVAVALSFDFDNETPSLRDNQTSPSLMSNGQYGARAGLPRVLALLDEYDVPASFFIPAVSALLYPDEVKTDRRRRARDRSPRVDPRAQLGAREARREGISWNGPSTTLTELTGKKPVGIRTPSWDYSPHTLEIIEELGLLYDSSLMADDCPVRARCVGETHGNRRASRGVDTRRRTLLQHEPLRKPAPPYDTRRGLSRSGKPSSTWRTRKVVYSFSRTTRTSSAIARESPCSSACCSTSGSIPMSGSRPTSRSRST